MTNCLIFHNFFLCMLLLLPTSLNASGIIEMRIFSPVTVLLEPTVCPNFECQAPDELSHPHKAQGGSILRFNTGRYHGEAREHIDLHLKVVDPITSEVIATEHFKPLADNEWNNENPLIVTTARGFNVTVELRNMCENFHYGKRCGRFCVPSIEQHWECSPDGERRCSAGWNGVDCSNPVCTGGCNGRGRCISPNKCSCIDGFSGTRCDKCVPRAGCVHGECLNNIPNTCKCKKGFIGDRCDIDINICSTQKPCANGGRCSIDSTTPGGFKCECAFNFLGPRCETPLASVLCSSAEHVCQNGGTCISMDEKTIQCICPKGFSGKLCEVGVHKDCSTMKCSKTTECRMASGVPMCVEKQIKKTRLNEKNMQTMELYDAEIQFVTISLIFCCILGLLFATIIAFKRFIWNRLRRNSSRTQTLPTTSKTSTNSSPVYKVCIIDAENAHSSSDLEPGLCPHRNHSPPPAYFPPVTPRTYKSIPSDETSSPFGD
uniref:Delta-like protein n=2 Tax=Caenorhabditis tropicalis TaxID=1561998 RepID=A0A1I7T631_9PELO